MAVTLFFTLHPLRSLRASVQAAKKAGLPIAEPIADEAPETQKAAGNVAISSARPGRERVNVQSASPVRVEPTAPASEQALLAARLRVDV